MLGATGRRVGPNKTLAYQHWEDPMPRSHFRVASQTLAMAAAIGLMSTSAHAVFNPDGDSSALQCVNKSASPDSVTEGLSTDVTYTINFDNEITSGSGEDFTNVVVIDDLSVPAGKVVEFSEATVSGAPVACSDGSGTLSSGDQLGDGARITCDFGDLPAGESGSLTLVLTIVDPAPDTTYGDQASVAADGVEETTSSSCAATVMVDDAPDGGNQGCTPGYWKQSQHFDEWDLTLFATDDLVSALDGVSGVFLAGAFDSYPGWWSTTGNGSNGKTDLDEDGEVDTLLDALDYPGGCGPTDKCTKPGAARILLRASVAAILNSSHPDVSYPTNPPSEIIDQVDNAIGSGDRDTMLGLASQLDTNNNLGCPLN